MRFRRRASLTLLLLLASVGCGGPKTVVVDAVVTLDGEPLAGATVLFVPEEGSRGRPAHGLTDLDGSLLLTTFDDDDGALPGAYRVVVMKSEGMIEQPQGERSSEEWARSHYERVVAREGKKPLVPPMYSDQATTPLHCTVPAGGRVKLELLSTSGP
jgi:hypothetical protein